MSKKPLLTEANKAFIKNNYLQMSGSRMAKMFGVEKTVVGRYMRKNGLKVPKELVIKWRSESAIRPYKDWEDEVIKDLIFTCSAKHIGTYLGRSCCTVYNRVRELGLGWVLTMKAEASRIQRGDVPANKGKKQSEFMTPEGIAISALTRFQKGHKCFNELYDNCITIRSDTKTGRKYKWIRIAKGKWRMLHVHNWEKGNGPVPKGYLVVFKTEDTMNCDTSNLELITRAEHIIRNTHHENPSDNRIATYLAMRKKKVDHDLKRELLKHPELIQTKRQSIILKRLIKNERRNNSKTGTAD